jgi:hypothetical protein
VIHSRSSAPNPRLFETPRPAGPKKARRIRSSLGNLAYPQKIVAAECDPLQDFVANARNLCRELIANTATNHEMTNVRNGITARCATGGDSTPVRTGHRLWGVSTYFSPAQAPIQLANLQAFANGVRSQGLRLLIVELAFGEESFVVEERVADRIVRVRCGDIMWQKERLLNLAIESLPETCDRVVWLDNDIVFQNERWVELTSRLLDEHVAVQPYDHCHWLAPVPGDFTNLPSIRPVTNIEYTSSGTAYEYHHFSRGFKLRGHPGFAWAARRSVLGKHGLYDRLILGGGDRIIAYAMLHPVGRWQLHGWAIDKYTSSHAADICAWAEAFYEDVHGDVGYVPGAVLHLWHGNLVNRGYAERYTTLKTFAFDPKVDIRVGCSGCWQWSSEKPGLHRRVIEHFRMRQEVDPTVRLI